MKKKNKILSFTALWFLAVLVSTVSAQSKYLDKNGILTFEASEQLFEEVKAVNKTVTAIYDEGTNQIAALALIKGFSFKNSLMEEHFNENYIESNTYPKATFKGILVDFDTAEGLTEENKEVKVKGILEVRGKEKEIKSVVTMRKIDNVISMTGEFKVTPADFDIDIPKIVRNKIAKEVHVKLDFKLTKK
jgi:hypothetical protein